MNETAIGLAAAIVHLLVQLAVTMRVMLRPHRQPASRIAWVVVIIALPIVGILAYLLVGETSIGHRRIARMKKVIDELPPVVESESVTDGGHAVVCDDDAHLFKIGHSISHFTPVGGNSAELMADSNAAIDAMVADIDAANEHVHLLFYIWLADNNGLKVADALIRAAKRGVKCRAMADGLGSRALIKSRHWSKMAEEGVHMAVALPFGNPLRRPLAGRIDLRNHRKILIIDDRVTYCGSQNCADPEFRVKAKYAPWVDAVMRFEGPIVRQNQHVFASDWMTYVDEDICHLLRRPLTASGEGFPAQVVATGPTVRYSAMPEMFESLMHAARHELVISSPYYVPTESLQDALCSAAYRGVDTTIIFPKRNDSWIVAAASRSNYRDLLSAGVKIHEYVGGLLHTKSLTMDGRISLIGSANMDRRSFELNYENNILLVDEKVTGDFRQRQQQYLDSSDPVTLQQVDDWSTARRLWNNTIAMLGPVL